MKSFEGEFKFQVDAKHFGFRWATAEFIEVQYMATELGKGKLCVTIMNQKVAPHLSLAVAMSGNWWVMYKEMEAAAKDHAEKELSGMDSNVHPTIMKALAPHI